MTKAERQAARIQREGATKQERFKQLRDAIPQQPLSAKELLSIRYGKKQNNRRPRHNQMVKPRGLRTDTPSLHGEVRQYSPEEITQANQEFQRTVGKAGVSVGMPTQRPLSPNAPRMERTTKRSCLAP